MRQLLLGTVLRHESCSYSYGYPMTRAMLVIIAALVALLVVGRLQRLPGPGARAAVPTTHAASHFADSGKARVATPAGDSGKAPAESSRTNGQIGRASCR